MKIKQKKIKFSVFVIVEPDGDRFHAYAPALKGLHVDGKSIGEAKENARDAAIVYFKSMIEYGDPIPLGAGKVAKKKKESKVFDLTISINLRNKNRIIAAFKRLIKKIAMQLGKWAA